MAQITPPTTFSYPLYGPFPKHPLASWSPAFQYFPNSSAKCDNWPGQAIPYTAWVYYARGAVCRGNHTRANRAIQGHSATVNRSRTHIARPRRILNPYLWDGTNQKRGYMRRQHRCRCMIYGRLLEKKWNIGCTPFYTQLIAGSPERIKKIKFSIFGMVFLLISRDVRYADHSIKRTANPPAHHTQLCRSLEPCRIGLTEKRTCYCQPAAAVGPQWTRQWYGRVYEFSGLSNYQTFTWLLDLKKIYCAALRNALVGYQGARGRVGILGLGSRWHKARPVCAHIQRSEILRGYYTALSRFPPPFVRSFWDLWPTTYVHWIAVQSSLRKTPRTSANRVFRLPRLCRALSDRTSIEARLITLSSQMTERLITCDLPKAAEKSGQPLELPLKEAYRTKVYFIYPKSMVLETCINTCNIVYVNNSDVNCALYQIAYPATQCD